MRRVVFTVVAAFSILTIGAYRARADEESLFGDAESRYFSAQYTVALETYREFIQQYPLSPLMPDARYRMAVCLFRIERYSEALDGFTAVEKRYRTTKYIEYVPFWMGTASYYLGDHSAARTYLDRYLERSSDPEFTRKARLYKSLAALSLEAYDEAVSSMRKLVSETGLGKMTPYEIVIYSYTLLKAGNYEEVLALERTVPSDTISPEYRERFLLYRAEAHWNLNNTDKAAEIYRQLVGEAAQVSDDTASVAYRRLYSIAQKENDFTAMEDIIAKAEERLRTSADLLTDLWLRIGIESYKRNEYQLAEHFLRKIYNRGFSKETNPAVPLYLSEIYTARGNTERARGVLEEYLEEYLEESKESPPEVILRLGNLLVLEGKYKEAAARIAPVADESRTGEGRYLYAFCLYKLARYDEALDVLDGGGKAPSRDGLRLKATILIMKDDNASARETLLEYTNMYPGDAGAQIDLLKVLFALKRYDELISAADRLHVALPSLATDDPGTYLKARYLEGLAEISLKRYENALNTFTYVSPEKLAETGLDTLIPQLEFYTGWANYRLGRFKIAARIYDGFIRRYPEHELTDRALYNGGFCYYSMGEYGRAADLFSQLEEKGKAPLSEKAALLRGESLKNLNRFNEAKQVFVRLYETKPESSYADNALFEHAALLAYEAGDKKTADETSVLQAASLYNLLTERYPGSELVGEALYRKGELYFDHARYTDARESFAAYRTRRTDTKGALMDAALYWEGMCAYRLREPRAAVLLWEIIITDYPSSTFVPDALRFSAEVYAGVGEYNKAILYYEKLTDGYPEYSKAVKAELRLEELRYLLFGLGEKEAELLAVISRNKGAETAPGRKAMVSLAGIYIEENKKLERAFQMLSQVLLKKDPEVEAEAQFLLGEYYAGTGDHVRAGEAFFNASLKAGEDGDFTAYAIYRAADMMLRAGVPREAEELVERLEKFFPDSEWAQEGKKLLERAE
ncbi:MAG: tetratricopeptide repeat protein [Spirochaetes bacterium]|nr:tetratricopeptide repeat protein [Spirochaetota bacterium]